MKILPTERPDSWEVQGRGELALAILGEQMRREGYELTIGKPQVVTREINDKLHEPVERLTIDIPEDYLGVITQLMAARKDRMEQMVNNGTGISNHVFEGYEPWFGEIITRSSGSLVSDRAGAVTSYAMTNIQERGTLFVEPTTEVYEGMVVGENSRSDDMEINIVREKKQSNVRAASSDLFEKLVPPRRLSLEQSLEFCREDECVEVTPKTARIRKVILDASERNRASRGKR